MNTASELRAELAQVFAKGRGNQARRGGRACQSGGQDSRQCQGASRVLRLAQGVAGDRLSEEMTARGVLAKENSNDRSVEPQERIWIEREGGCPYFYHEEELSDVAPPVTEYVRADKLEELAAETEALRTEVDVLKAENEMLREALKDAEVKQGEVK